MISLSLFTTTSLVTDLGSKVTFYLHTYLSLLSALPVDHPYTLYHIMPKSEVSLLPPPTPADIRYSMAARPMGLLSCATLLFSFVLLLPLKPFSSISILYHYSSTPRSGWTNTLLLSLLVLLSNPILDVRSAGSYLSPPNIIEFHRIEWNGME